MPAAKIIAAAALIALVGAPREFGIGGGPILCVPEREIDADATPYRPDTKRLQGGGGAAFAFQFGAADIRRRVPGFAVDPALADLRAASTLSGWLGFVDEARPEPGPGAPTVTCRHETLRPGSPGAVELRTCSRTTRIDGFLVTYEIQERNVLLVASLDQFLADKIAAWRDACHATDRM